MSRLFCPFPAHARYREVRPEYPYEDFYKLMIGYGALFDPAVLNYTGAIPIPANGVPADLAPGDRICAFCDRADHGFLDAYDALRVANAFPAAGGTVRGSEKECFRLGGRETLYPRGLSFQHFPDAGGGFRADGYRWQGRSLVRRKERALLVGFDLFGIAYRLSIGEEPEDAYLDAADRLLELLALKDGRTADSPLPETARPYRLDFQAYGVNRLLIEFLGEVFGTPVDMAGADRAILEGASRLAAGDTAAAAAGLADAFGRLKAIRYGVTPTRLVFVEVPHIGILLDNVGFFEFEWPEFTARRLEQLMDYADAGGVRLAFEAGGGCWKHFAARYPATAARLGRLAREGKIELTNGTYSLPYSLLSSTAAQYWQFAAGAAAFKETFGFAPSTYQCQENAFTPLTPRLLEWFGLTGAMHIVQNRGRTPVVDRPFFHWGTRAAGRVRAVGIPREELGRKGNNYFYDLPLVLKSAAGEDGVYYPNFQDIAFIPLRAHLYRSARYAAVWGEFSTPGELFRDFPADAQEREFEPEAYGLAEQAFYPLPSGVDALSQLAAAHDAVDRIRRLQFSAYLQGRLPRHFDAINALLPAALLQEAHDAVACPGTVTGEFYAANTRLVPGVGKRTLREAVRERKAELDAACGRIQRELGAGAAGLLNAGPAPLALARATGIADGEEGACFRVNGELYASGDFPPFATAHPRPVCFAGASLPLEFAGWRLACEAGGLEIRRDGQTVRLGVADARRGALRLADARARADAAIAHLELAFTLAEDGRTLHRVDVNALIPAESPLVEFQASYLTAAALDCKDRWSDYLAIEFAVAGGVRALRQHSPGLNPLLRGTRIASPGYLIANDALQFLNDGAGFYEFRPEAGAVRALLHVAGETVWRRRMGLRFDCRSPGAFARSWALGVSPSGPIQRTLPSLDAKELPELFAKPDRLLTSVDGPAEGPRLRRREI